MSFVLGANLPWIRYGGDFGANNWSPEGGLATRPDDQRRALDVLLRLRDLGLTRLRWFFLCDLRAGVRFHADGTPLELDRSVWRDVDTAIDIVRRAGLSLMPVLFDFHLLRPRRLVNGAQLGGRARLIRVRQLRTALLDNIVGPLLAQYGHTSEIDAWDLFNEPEWATFAVGTWNPVSSVSRATMRAFLVELANRVHAVTRHSATVGTASVRTLPLVQGVGLDFYQPHWYDRFESRSPLARPIASLGCDAPVMLGEFPTCNSSRSPAELFSTAEQQGFTGAYFWSAMADDEHSQLEQAVAALASRVLPASSTPPDPSGRR
jgi:hypothetical protein